MKQYTLDGMAATPRPPPHPAEGGSGSVPEAPPGLPPQSSWTRTTIPWHLPCSPPRPTASRSPSCRQTAPGSEKSTCCASTVGPGHAPGVASLWQGGEYLPSITDARCGPLPTRAAAWPSWRFFLAFLPLCPISHCLPLSFTTFSLDFVFF